MHVEVSSRYVGGMPASDLSAPAHAAAAPSHPDPYPYYADLVSRRPIFHDEGLGAWVVSSAAMVRSVLEDARFAVRPSGAPVPRELVGNAAGAVFGRMVRMNDGEDRLPLKRT